MTQNSHLNCFLNIFLKRSRWKHAVVSQLQLMTSPNIMHLNLGKRSLHWCSLGAAVSRQLITTCVCAYLSNKCSSQSCVLFRVQQHTTMPITISMYRSYLVLFLTPTGTSPGVNFINTKCQSLNDKLWHFQFPIS